MDVNIKCEVGGGIGMGNTCKPTCFISMYEKIQYKLKKKKMRMKKKIKPCILGGEKKNDT